jgi:transcriptional regulator with XRE-family HTH domain
MTRKILSERDIRGPEGRQLKARLALRGLRVEDVAAAAGMSQPTLYRVLAGTRALTEDERARLLDVLDDTAVGGGRA